MIMTQDNFLHALSKLATADEIELLSYVYLSAKSDAKFFNFFARLFILFYFRSKKFRTSVNGKTK